MTNEERILAMLTDMKSDMSQVKSDISALKEEQQEMRDSLNTFLGWADDVACVVKVPLKPAQ